MDIQIKMAEKNQSSQLADMRLAYLNDDFGGLTEEQTTAIRAQLPDYFEEHIGKEFFPFVAEVDGEIVATAFLLVTEKPANPEFLTGKTGMLLNVYTKPEYRYQGIAAKVIEAVKEKGRQEGLSYLELSATDQGIRLYEKTGFKRRTSHYTEMILEFE
ncbi:GNAT family N-acetyltransferase [Anaerolentibacter hominis]|uniref:GNAT family N-acetyltransferase n=1 Tax=Anaerolentibacter hominis TaxID=3079009 RepID=UPI0031B82928